MKNITVLGFGSWGISLSLLFHKNGHCVTAWQRSPEKTSAADSLRECPEYLPGVKIPAGIKLTSDISEAVQEADILVFTVGSKATREVANLASPYLSKNQILVNASKGLEPQTNLRLSQVLSQIAPDNLVAVISGPCHAEELSRGIVTTYVASSEFTSVSEIIQEEFMSSEFRVYTNSDIIGVELGGALKNIMALAAGVADGLGFGDNTKAALMTRGIAEMSRLGVAMGAKPQTFSGLAGIGDLIVTCTSLHSRNRRAGILLGQGKSLKETLESVHMLVEGVNTAPVARLFAQKYNVSMPITEEINKVLFEGKNPRDAVESLMSREKTTENELFGMFI